MGKRPEAAGSGWPQLDVCHRASSRGAGRSRCGLGRWRGFTEHLLLAFLYFAAPHGLLAGGWESLFPFQGQAPRPAVLAVGLPRRRHRGCGGGGSSSQPQEVGAGRGAQAQKNRKAGVVWHLEARGSPPRGRENETQVCEHRLREAGTCPTPASCKSETLCLFRLPARPSSGSVFSTVAGRAASPPAQFSCVHR